MAKLTESAANSTLNSPANANQTENEKTQNRKRIRNHEKNNQNSFTCFKKKKQNKINAFITKFESDFNFVFNLSGFIHNIDRSEADLESVFLVPRNFYKQFF